jgi:galactose mutarotase-like enzyme
MKFQNQDVVQIENAHSTALFAPQHGGRLLRWSLGDLQIVHWPAAADWSAPARIRGGNPLLFPFIGRHFVDGQAGRWVDSEGVQRTMPLHGFAPGLPYSSQVDADGAGLRMTLEASDMTRAAYPYEFRFVATYRLAGPSLCVTLSTQNLGDKAMPYYAGHHFYFSLPHGARDSTLLHLPPNQLQSLGGDGVLAPANTGETTYRLSDPRLQDRFHVLKRGGDVRLVAPEFGREITLGLQSPGGPDWYAIGTWAERPDVDYYCIEPWLGAPNAIHHGRGLRWLAPGQREDALCAIDVKLQ